MCEDQKRTQLKKRLAKYSLCDNLEDDTALMSYVNGLNMDSFSDDEKEFETVLTKLKANKELFEDIRSKINEYKSPYYFYFPSGNITCTATGTILDLAIILIIACLIIAFICCLIYTTFRIIEDLFHAHPRSEKSTKIQEALKALTIEERQDTNLLSSDTKGAKQLQDALKWHRDDVDTTAPDTKTWKFFKEKYIDPTTTKSNNLNT